MCECKYTLHTLAPGLVWGRHFVYGEWVQRDDNRKKTTEKERERENLQRERKTFCAHHNSQWKFHLQKQNTKKMNIFSCALRPANGYITTFLFLYILNTPSPSLLPSLPFSFNQHILKFFNCEWCGFSLSARIFFFLFWNFYFHFIFSLISRCSRFNLVYAWARVCYTFVKINALVRAN